MKIATAAWPVERHENWTGFTAKAEAWVREAAENGAQLLLFPEYASMELASIVENGTDLKQSLSGMQPLFRLFCGMWTSLAERYRTTIVAPSFPVLASGEYYNEAWVFGPNGARGHQAKIHMTRFESENWGISAGSGLTLFDLGGATAAVAICYDVEFADQVRALAAAGADLILVPSCTDTDAGYTRVSITARARAIENQCFVVQASTVGAAPWSPALDINTGAGAVFGPADQGFPPDGIIAQGRYNAPGWTYATLDFEALAKVRRDGQVLNHRDGKNIEYGRPSRILMQAAP
jgi:Predicted amidohydrolase